MSGSMPVSRMPTTWPSPKIPWLKIGVVCPPERPDWPTQTVVSLSSDPARLRSRSRRPRGTCARASRCAAISAGVSSRRMREKNGLGREPTTPGDALLSELLDHAREVGVRVHVQHDHERLRLRLGPRRRRPRRRSARSCRTGGRGRTRRRPRRRGAPRGRASRPCGPGRRSRAGRCRPGAPRRRAPPSARPSPARRTSRGRTRRRACPRPRAALPGPPAAAPTSIACEFREMTPCAGGAWPRMRSRRPGGPPRRMPLERARCRSCSFSSCPAILTPRRGRRNTVPRWRRSTGRQSSRGRHQSHRRPVGRGGGNPLVGAVREAALEVRLERDRPAPHVPRPVFELRGQQELDPAPGRPRRSPRPRRPRAARRAPAPWRRRRWPATRAGPTRRRAVARPAGIAGGGAERWSSSPPAHVSPRSWNARSSVVFGFAAFSHSAPRRTAVSYPPPRLGRVRLQRPQRRGRGLEVARFEGRPVIDEGVSPPAVASWRSSGTTPRRRSRRRPDGAPPPAPPACGWRCS